MHKHWLTFILVLFLCACSSKEASLRELARFEMDNTATALNQLKQQLQNDVLDNGRKLDTYAKALKKIKPQYSGLISTMQSHADPNGPMIRALEQRLQDVRKAPDNNISRLENTLTELQNIAIAAQPAIFNDALGDSVNVLADLSEGELPRVQTAPRSAVRDSNERAYRSPGAHLIGNPMYGSWERGPDGDLIWTWALAYIIFDDILDLDDAFERRHYRYGSWSRYRPYSYYHDYGRYHYSSPRQLTRQVQVENRVAKNFQQQGKKFKSPYAKKASGSGRVSVASKSSSQSSSFRSKSAFSSSSRSSASRMSRGPRSGK